MFKRKRIRITSEIKVHFFGVFANNTKEFRFVIEDKILIRRLVQFVNDEISSGGKSPFNMPVKYTISRKNTIQLSAGLFFGQIDAKCESKTHDSTNLKTDLFEKVKRLMVSGDLIQVRPVTEDIIRIINAGGRIRAEVTCIYCPENIVENEKPKVVSVQAFTGANSTSFYWTTSNLKKHLEKHHKIKFECDVAHFESNDQKCEENQNEIHHTGGMKEQIMDEFSEPATVKVETVHTCDVNNDTNDQMYKQISEQMNKVARSVIMNNEEKGNIKIQIGNGQRFIQVAKVPRDGSCLFSAMAHQLFHDTLSPAPGEHSERADELRAQVVAHIKANFEQYKHALKGRIFDEESSEEESSKKSTKKSIKKVTKKSRRKRTEIEMDLVCEKFLNKDLTEKKCWGGYESLMALRELYNVNIVIFREMDSFSFLEQFEATYDRTVCLAYRLKKKPKCDKDIEKIYNHYDSVSGINNK